MKVLFQPKWFIAIIFFATNGVAQPFKCGSTLPVPALSPKQWQSLDSQLTVAKLAYDLNPESVDAIIWYARRLGYLARFPQAIEVLTAGIQKHPADARMYRHRGHRYITLRCMDKAIADLEKAAQLVEGKNDEIEPDGQPNEANIPTSTLQSNIFYHLGLAYYLQKNYTKALEAYKKCLGVSTNPDMYTATANWYYLTLRRLERREEASKFLQSLNFDLPLIENGVYRKILLLHKEKPGTHEALLSAQGGADVQSATFLYGLYMYLKLNDHPSEASEVKDRLLRGAQYGSFGFIAAEME